MRGRTRLTLAAALLGLALVGSGCTKSSTPPSKSVTPQPRAMPVKATGTAKAVKIAVPKSVTAGLTRIDFTNDAQGRHSLQIARVDGARSPAKALAAANAWLQNGRPLPGWVHPAGGAPVTQSGAHSSAIQLLSPGDYFVIDPEAGGSPKVGATFNVTGKLAGKVQGSPARIAEFEYGFKSTGLTAGLNRVLIDNKGAQPHLVEAVPLKPGKTLADVRRSLKDRTSAPPVDSKAGFNTPIIDGHSKQLIDLEFTKKGKWALLCFVPDRKGGPPHALKGMVAVAEVR